MHPENAPPTTDNPDPFLRAEDGMITILSVVSVFGFAVLAALVGSVGVAVNQKIEAQNAADAVALSCSVQRARTMNAVTACNHLTGELLSAVVLHEALGGWVPGDADPSETNPEDERLRGAYMAHEAIKNTSRISASTPAYDDVRKKVKAYHALLDAHRELKHSLADLYLIKTLILPLGSFREAYPVGTILYGIGEALYQVCTLIERFMQVEWKALDLMRQHIADLQPIREVRNLIYDRLPNIRGHAERRVSGSPSLLTDTAEAIGKRNSTDGAVYVPRPGLKIEPEPVPLDAPEQDSRRFFAPSSPPTAGFKPPHWRNPPAFARSQLVRAAYPWVNYHRRPVLDFTRWMVFSDFPKHYRNWTTEVTLLRAQANYGRDGTRLHVLADIEDPDRKSRAPWFESTRSSELAFAVVGVVRKPPPERWAPRFLPATNSGGTVAFAQSLLYNANPRRPSPDDANYQPVTGWDTLNWHNGDDGTPGHAAAVEWPHYKKAGEPKTRLNWQAKLVPVSLLGDAVPTLDAKFRTVLGKLDAGSPLAHGH